ncbi:hypothetical protein RFI_31492, partial [Reticulomyxa filosa]
AFYDCACVCVNNAILFFGGWNARYGNRVVSKSVYKYSIQENKWMTFQNTLPNPSYACSATLSEDNMHVHIIGGYGNIFTHMKTEVGEWSSAKGIELKVKKDNGVDRQINTPFQTLKELPTTFSSSQCVLYKHEILICGGEYQRACYSYHTLKDEYNDINQITLLSFGGDESKHTLVMKYVSVWSDDNNSDDANEMNKAKKFNEW